MGNVNEANHETKALHQMTARNSEPLLDAERHVHSSKT